MHTIELFDHELIKKTIKDDFEFVKSVVKNSLIASSNPQDAFCPPKNILKDYLDHKISNRIINMPAYLYAPEKIIGMKWVSSKLFNDSQKRGSSLTILNDPDTYLPIAILDSKYLNMLRTFAMSLIFLDLLKYDWDTVCCIGLGKLGKLHLEFLPKIYNNIKKIKYFSKNAPYPKSTDKKCIACSSFDEALQDADVVIACGSQSDPYIKTKHLSKKTKLILNLSLFDFAVDVFEHSESILVDDLETCAKSKNPFAIAYKNNEFVSKNTQLIGSVLKKGEVFTGSSGLVMVNPQGIATEDILLAKKVYDKIKGSSSLKLNIE